MSRPFWLARFFFVTLRLRLEKVLPLNKTQNSFGFLLAYSYLCKHDEERTIQLHPQLLPTGNA